MPALTIAVHFLILARHEPADTSPVAVLVAVLITLVVGARALLRKHDVGTPEPQARDDLDRPTSPASTNQKPKVRVKGVAGKVRRNGILTPQQRKRIRGWHVDAEGKIFRRPGSVRLEVSSGVDWFELHGEVDYGGASAKLPALLAALRRGENNVRLDDGTYGLLPEEWLSRFGPIAGLGAVEADHLRFRPNQAGLLDALLATQPEVSCDATFARVRDELRSFAGICATDQPKGFEGHLRDYQKEGVGWMDFLRRFGFGGCLADDMGVGKTAQVLALLEARRGLRDAPGPSLVVVPRSLVFNWKQEAARFTPRLRVLDHTGLARDVNGFANYDLVLTTYGTLRRDAAKFTKPLPPARPARSSPNTASEP